MKKKSCFYWMLLLGQYLFLFLFSSFAIQIVISMKDNFSQFQSVSAFKIAIYMLGLIGILIYYIWRCTRNEKGLRIQHYLKWGGILLWLILQSLYIWSTYSQAGSDAYVVNYFAYCLANNSECEVFYWEYFARYQNNIPLAFLYVGIWRMIKNLVTLEQSWVFFSILAALFSDIAIWWTVKLSNILCEGARVPLFSILCAIFLIGLSEESSIFYSDIVSLWTIPCSLYFTIVAFDKQEKVLKNAIIAGLILGLGSTFKPQVFIIAVATFIVRGLMYLHSFVESYKKCFIKNFVVFFVAMFITGFSLSKACYAWYVSALPDQYDATAYMEEHKIPVLHWINMGLNQSSNGSYNVQDHEILNSEDKIKALTSSIKERLSALSITEFFAFENNKVFSAIRDGSFSEGLVWKGTLLNESQFAMGLQQHFVAIYDGWKNGIGLVIQSLYILILTICLYAIYKSLRTGIWIDEGPIQVISISMVGCIFFIMLLERNIRYFYSMIPLLIALSSRGLRFMTEKYVDRDAELQTKK